LNATAVAWICSSSSSDNSSMVRRWRRFQGMEWSRARRAGKGTVLGSERRCAGGRCGRRDAHRVALCVLCVEGDDNLLRLRRDEIEADVIGGQGQAPPTAIDEDGQFDFGRPAVIEQFIERGFHRAAGEENVIDQNNRRAVNVGRDLRRGEFLGDGMAADVVAVEGDVQGAGAGADFPGEPLRQLHAAVGNAEQEQLGRVRMPRRNGFGEPRNGSLDLAGSNRLSCGHRGWL
jgi:hypothetical protein